MACAEDDQAADEEGDDRSDDRDRDPARALQDGQPASRRRGGGVLVGIRRRRSVLGGQRLGHATASFLRAPSISRPISSSSIWPVCSPTISPSYMTRMRSESESTSSSSSEMSRIARPSSRSSTRRRWRYSIAPTSRPRVGCAAIEDLRVAGDLARCDELLLVAARERRRPSSRAASADVELLDQTARPLDEAAREEPAPARSGRIAVVVQRDVLGERELEHEPAPVAVLRDVPHPCVEHLRARSRARSRARRRSTFPETGRRSPVIASISSVWPLPSTPARPTISPARTVSETPLTAAQPALVVDLEVSHLQQRLAGLCRLLFHAEQHLAADHHAREARLGRALARNGVDPLAAPQDRDPVGDLEHLVQLVADEDDRRALLLEALDDPEQLARLLRGQHGRRLVEDQDLGAAVERLQDLDALLLPDADGLDLRLRVDGEPEAGRGLAHALSAPLWSSSTPALVGSTARTMFSATRHHRDQHEVLVHHPDPAVDRVLGRVERDRLAVEPDLALVGLVEAVEDVHQRRLARAVLAQQRMHLALPQVEVDVVVGDDAREALRDAPHLEDGGRLHCVRDSMVTDGRTRFGARACAGTLTWPEMIFCFSSFILSMKSCGTAGLILPTAMPPFFRLKSRSLPPLNLPSVTCLVALKTPSSTRLTPLVSTRLASLYWSLSTPMPQMPALVGRLQRAEAAAAGDLEEHLGALRDLVLGDRLALVRPRRSPASSRPGP